ncbi:cuticle-like protein 7, partial [Leptotrombidium deliense]
TLSDYEHQGHNDHDNHVYKPYGFGYEIQDGWGNSQYRHEKGSGPWDVKGSYGYKDAWGIYRHVDYTADKWGYRANVKTNEPGTAPKNPASVRFDAHPDSSAHKHVTKHGHSGYSTTHHGHESRHIETVANPTDV